MRIEKYKKEYTPYFISLNKEWILKYFKLEKQDIALFDNIDKYIENGSEIFFAIKDNIPISTCMIMKINDNEFELCKLATKENFRKQGIATLLINECIDYAKKQNAKKIIIESNTILQSAIKLYKKLGFCEVENTNKNFDRVNIILELNLK